MLSMGAGHLTVVDLDTEKAKHLTELLAKEFGAERIAVASPGEYLGDPGAEPKALSTRHRSG